MKATLVYDADCAFCNRCVRWMERRLPRLPEIVGFQFADLDALGVTRESCERAVQWVPPTGPTLEGADAIAKTLQYAGGVWRFVGRLMLLPGLRVLARLGYRWVANHRDLMPGGSAECAVQLPPADAGATPGTTETGSVGRAG